MQTVAAQINQINRPSDIPRSTWRHLLSVLRALAKFLPDPYPSQRELARRVQLDQRTVGRLLIRAEELGLITRTPRVTPSGHRSYSYALLLEAKREAFASEKNTPPTEERREAPPPGEPGGLGPPAPSALSFTERRHRQIHGYLPNRFRGRCNVCGYFVGELDGFMRDGPLHRFCISGQTDESQLKEYLSMKSYEREHQADLNPSGVIGDDPSAAHGTTVVTTDPATALATRFETLWFTEILAQYPLWRSHRVMHRGAAVHYIRTQFLAKGYSPEYVEAYFDAFFDDLMDPASTLDLRENQQPWQLFTGWWGRTEVLDPAIERARREERQRIHDLFESKYAAEQPLIDAARDRLAALPDGEIGDPEDYRLLGWGVPVKRNLG